MSNSGLSDNWMSPEDALSRFKNEELSLLDLSIQVSEDTIIRYGYRFNNIGFIVGDGVLSEVISDYCIFPVPNCAEWLAGLANVRGNLVPVYDFQKLLGLEISEEQLQYRHLLILDKGADSIGILITTLPEALDIINWKPKKINYDFNTDMSAYINTTYLDDSVTWIDFDHKQFFKSIKEKIAA